MRMVIDPEFKRTVERFKKAIEDSSGRRISDSEVTGVIARVYRVNVLPARRKKRRLNGDEINLDLGFR